jgi:hypothetical protein
MVLLKRTMRFSIQLIAMAFFLPGMIATGCRSTHSGSEETRESINQFDKSGMKSGPWEVYSDSSLVARGSYSGGKQEGLWTYYYKDGHMKEEGHYRKGIKEGMWVEWYPDGEIMWKGEWISGTRNIEQKEANPRITFLGHEIPDHTLTRDSVYDLQIRIPNIPASHLFVEVNHGSISRVDHSDHFILHTSSDSALTLAVGFIPDLQFPDFRNLVGEYQYHIK